MALQEAIESAFLTAYKEKKELEVAVLRMLKATLKNKKIELIRALNDDEVVEVIRGEIKKRKDSVELYTQGNRPELAEKEAREIVVLQSFLPTELSAEAIRAKVDELIKDIPAAELNAGKVMGLAMKELKGKADGGTINKVVREAIEARQK